MNENKHTELPFGIDFVVSSDLGSLPGFNPRKASGSSYDIDCPFCGGKRKMNINTAKNVAKCNKCGCGNGYNAITLHAALTGLSNKESYADLQNRWNGLDSEVKLSFESKVTESLGLVPCDIAIRDKVYRRLLERLSLSTKHEQDLVRRGLTHVQITEGMYKSVPCTGFHTLAYDAVYESGAIKMLSGHKNWGIPGFTDIDNPSKIALRGRKSGYFVPVKTMDGYISGMQIRYDALPDNASQEEKDSYKKYSWYSSSEKETGCTVTGCENIHFAGDWSTIPEDINLTEGVLKADVAAALSEKPFLGLVGVNNMKQLEKVLSRLMMLGAKHVNLYIDMDYKEKKEVAAALLGIKKEINKVGDHSFTAKEGEELSIREALYQNGGKSIKLKATKDFPKELLLFIGRHQIPKEKYHALGSEIEIEYDFMRTLKNSSHKIRIVNAEKGFEYFSDLSPEERGRLLLENLIGKLSFTKTGLSYTEMEWDSQYKGIDDFYLFRKTMNI